MTEVICDRICETCPINTGTTEVPVVLVEIGYEVPAQVMPGPTGNSFTIEFQSGRPVNMDQRTSTIAVATTEDRMMRARFRAPGRMLDDGSAAKRFEDCKGPTQERYGFLWLKRRAVCAALKSFRG